MKEFTREIEVAIQLAREAGAAALGHYGSTVSEEKEDGSPVTAADYAANAVIAAGLREVFPDDAILSEESRDDRHRLEARRVWIVDPLDGTREFLARNGEFAIMIGLVDEGVPVLGVVYLPDGDVLFQAVVGQGTYVDRNGGVERLRPGRADPGALRMVSSRSHGDSLIDRIRDALGVTDVGRSGSVGIKCSLVATGQRDLYVHPVSYLREWDTCAPEVILREAGGSVSDCLGSPLEYNKPDTQQPHGILATAPGIHNTVLDVVRPLYEEHGAGAAV